MTKVGRFRFNDAGHIQRCRDNEAEFMNELHGANGERNQEPAERPEQAAAREFKRKSRERWSGRTVQTAAEAMHLSRDAQLTPTQRFKAASRARYGGR